MPDYLSLRTSPQTGVAISQRFRAGCKLMGIPTPVFALARNDSLCFLQSDGLHDALQGNLNGFCVGQLCGRLAVTVAAVDRFGMGQHAKEL